MSGDGLDDRIDRSILRLKSVVIQSGGGHGIEFDYHHVGNRIHDEQLTAEAHAREPPARRLRNPPETTVGPLIMARPWHRRSESDMLCA